MKKFIQLAVLVSMVYACKETCPPIDFGVDGVLVLQDTSYQLTEENIPEANLRAILIEDCTGVSCVFCPGASKVAADIKDTLTPNPVVVIGIYPESPISLTGPIEGYEDLFDHLKLVSVDNRLLGTSVYNYGTAIPAGGVNRVIFDLAEGANVPFQKWLGKANSFINSSAICNIELEKEFINDSTVNVQGKVVFTESANSDPFISVFLLEDNIKYPQKLNGSTDYDYKQKHVLRKFVTPHLGSSLLSVDVESATRGTVFEKGWQVTIPSYVDVNNSSIVALVNYNDGDNKEVVQCIEMKLK